jgi:hypothetical protein
VASDTVARLLAWWKQDGQHLDELSLREHMTCATECRIIEMLRLGAAAIRRCEAADAVMGSVGPNALEVSAVNIDEHTVACAAYTAALAALEEKP